MDRRWNEEDWEKIVSMEMILVCDMESFMQKTHMPYLQIHSHAIPVSCTWLLLNKELGTKARQGMTSALADQARLPPLKRVLL
jgi:hypothetical protein